MNGIGDMAVESGSAPGATADVSDRAELCARRLRRGEPRAVDEVRSRVDRILAHRGLGMSQADRDDLRQEVMIQVWQAVNRPGFDPTAGFWGFVELVTARRCVDWLRRTARPEMEAAEPPGAVHVPSLALLGRERLRLASLALSALDAPCRELISLHLEDGKGYRELSEILGKSQGALRVQMYRCIRRARKLVDEMAARRTVEAEVEGEAT
jgi:RNA polymerase sigma factor (sigma-70 family)